MPVALRVPFTISPFNLHQISSFPFTKEETEVQNSRVHHERKAEIEADWIDLTPGQNKIDKYLFL